MSRSLHSLKRFLSTRAPGVVKLLKKARDRSQSIFETKTHREMMAIYEKLYEQVHDLEQAHEPAGGSTQNSFYLQWKDLPSGQFLLSDDWFRENVTNILCKQELLLKPEWFTSGRPKKVLDAGCGSGRWAYGFSKLGADLTCVDVNESALNATKQALKEFSNPQKFVQTPLEQLDKHIEAGAYDLAFSWGVIHHCQSFNRSLANVARAVRPGGLIYLYLYGRESIPLKQDLELFRKRIHYNLFMDEKARYQFLLNSAGGDKNQVHNQHDIFAPLINRRFTFEEVSEMLRRLGFSQIVQTIRHSEVFVRAVKGNEDYSQWTLPPRPGPYWFENRTA